MGEQWKPSALRAAGDIDRQAADDIEFGVTISTRDGRQLVHEWRDAIARAERAELRLTQYRKLAIDDHVLAIGQHLKVVHERDAALARAERAEAALAAVPWQALLNIYECLTLPAVALDGDVDTLAAFLNQYAPWVPNGNEG